MAMVGSKTVARFARYSYLARCPSTYPRVTLKALELILAVGVQMRDVIKPAHDFVLVASSEDALMAQCKSIRMRVFVDEQKFPAEAEIDEYDEPGRSIQILLRLLPSEDPIGTVRLVFEVGKVGRLCLLPSYRKFGFGRDLMDRCHRAAKDSYGLRQVQLHAQVPVIPFYERLGYEPEGARFDQEGAPHQKMILNLSE